MHSQNDSKKKGSSPWISGICSTPEACVTLYCLPYAGGDVSIFKNWYNQLPSSIDVCPIKLPGRGTRIDEPAHTSISTLAAEIAKVIEMSSTRPYAVFGHSMGALLAFEAARIIRSNGGPMPFHLFVSGCAAPHVRRVQRTTYQLPNAEFIADIQRLNGTPAEFFNYSELVSLLLPMLRADFQACQTYVYHPQEILDVDITVLGGERDLEVSASQLCAWRDLTGGRVRVETVPGDHFFLHHFERHLLAVVSAQLDAAIQAKSNKNKIDRDWRLYS